LHVLVCGAGVIGVTTAYYLAALGHKVTVVDRREGPGEETSFANGGQLSPSHADPWASPANLKRIIGWMGRENAPLLYAFRREPALWEWSLRFLLNCRAGHAERNSERMLRVALFGLEKFRELLDETGIECRHRDAGILHIFRTQRAFDEARRQAEFVTAQGCSQLPASAGECVALEPALEAASADLVGGVHCPDDETADAHAFCIALAARCADMGVAFDFDTSIASLTRRGKRVIDAQTTRGPFRADAYVLALGSFSPLIAETADLRLPVYPAKGYSVTLPVVDAEKAPVMGLIDGERKHVYSRLGDQLRVAGMAEFVGFDTYVDRGRAGYLCQSAEELFKAGVDGTKPEFWSGLRPQTPDSVPIIGRTRVENLYLNTGHGTLGWTMACGSGHALAHLIAGRSTGIDMAGLGPDRFRGL